MALKLLKFSITQRILLKEHATIHWTENTNFLHIFANPNFTKKIYYE